MRRGRGKKLRPRRLGGASGRPFNFTVSAVGVVVPSSTQLRIALGASLLANVILGGFALFRMTTDPLDRVGVLTRAVQAHPVGDDKRIIVLPRGLTVKDASPRGIAAAGMFEPSRFTIVLTGNYLDLVDYSPAKATRNFFGEYYSIETR